MSQLNQILQKISYHLILLLPFTLITGPFIPDLTAVLVSIFVLINFKSVINPKIFNKKILLLILIFNIWIIFCTLISDNILFSLKTSLFYFRFLTFSLGHYYFLNLDQKFSLKFFYVLLLAFFVLILDGYTQYFSGSNIFGFELQPGPRVSSFFDKELILKLHIKTLLVVGLYLYNIDHFSNKKLITFSIALALILSECLVFLSGERAAFFFINLSAFFMIVFLNGFKLIRIYTLLISFALIILIINFNPNTKNRIFDLTLKQTGISENNSQIYLFSETHENYFRTALNIYKSNYIFGTGPKTYRKNCSNPMYVINKYSCSTHPHNTYVQLLSETGTFGFILIFLLFLNIIYFSIKELFFNKYKVDDKENLLIILKYV